MTHLLQANDISCSYENSNVISNLSLTLNDGQFIGLIGANGAGKTTLMLALSGQFKPTSGNIFWHDKDIYAENFAYKTKVGYVHEVPFFYPYMTVAEHLYFVAKLKHIPQQKIHAAIQSAMEKTQLAEHANKLTSQLSLGMRKKLAIAAAGLGSPQILFLDEALNGVDVESVYSIKAWLAQFVKEGGTVILSTHVLEVIEKICDRYIVMKNGVISADILARDFSQQSQADLEQHVLELLKAQVADTH